MKELTHNLFSIGLGFYLVSRMGDASLFFAVWVLWLAVVINAVIDRLGHTRRGGVPTRSFVTHSVLTAPLWGAGVAATSAYAYGAVEGPLSDATITLIVGLGVIFAYSHLLLDAVTEAGIFLWRHRIALAHARYDNRLLNTSFSAIGIIFLLLAATTIP